MLVSLILAHPDPSSFNHAIASTARQELEHLGHTVRFHDLYAERFDPLLGHAEIPRGARLTAHVEAHCREAAEADALVVVHPNWWGMPPAILTGWVDRVLRPGTAYEFLGNDGGEGVPRGLLRARTAIVLNTSNTEALREATVFGDPLEAIWKNCIFDLCGVKSFRRRTFRIVVTSTAAQRKTWLDQVRDEVRSIDAEAA